MTFAKAYEETRQAAEGFKGMMGPLSIALFEAFLSYQDEEGITGDMIEFGVYEGKSASVMLRHLNPDETAYLVDVADYPKLDALGAICPQFEFHKGKSEDLLQQEAIQAKLADGVRYSHHDASHFYNNVYTEMEGMAHRIKPKGLMVLDDYQNPCFQQVSAASFRFLSREDNPLEVALVANNKAYLCRKEDFDFYAHFIVKVLMDQLAEAGHDCYVARTDNHPDYRAFAIDLKPNPDYPTRYGENTYGDIYYRV